MPPPSEVLQALAAVRPYGGLSHSLQQELASASALRSCAANERVASEGEAVASLYLVVEGSLLAHRGETAPRARAVFHVERGQTLGETILLRYPTWPFDVTAVRAGTRLVEVQAQAFLDLFHRECELQNALVTALGDKVIQLSERLVDLSVASANTRLARYLMRLPEREVAGIAEVELPLPKKDLAALLAITPEHLSRILRRWSDARLVRIAGRGVQVLNRDVLRALADIDEDIQDVQGLTSLKP